MLQEYYFKLNIFSFSSAEFTRRPLRVGPTGCGMIITDLNSSSEMY
jgi:hypothetical protein